MTPSLRTQISWFWSFTWTSIWATKANVVQLLPAWDGLSTVEQHWLSWPKCSSMMLSHADKLHDYYPFPVGFGHTSKSWWRTGVWRRAAAQTQLKRSRIWWWSLQTRCQKMTLGQQWPTSENELKSVWRKETGLLPLPPTPTDEFHVQAAISNTSWRTRLVIKCWPTTSCF